MKSIVLAAGIALLFASSAPARGPLKDMLVAAKPMFCLAAEKTPAWQATLPKGRGAVRARWEFSLADVGSWTSLTLQSSQSVESCTLNGSRVPLPVKGMRYATLPGVSPRLLKAGANTLEIEFGLARSGKKKSPMPVVELRPLGFADLDFQTEAVLGDAAGDYFSVGCRTNMPSTVTLAVGDRHWESPRGLMHIFRATGLQPGTSYNYTLTATAPGGGAKKQIGPFVVSTLPAAGQPFHFVAMGDSRTYRRDWARVAASVVEKKPALVLFSGDMVTDGREDRLWDADFFRPAKPYFASIPTFYVIGNHEHACPLVGTLVPVLDREHWSMAAGGVRFIGIDGELDWSASGENLKWLEAALQQSREPFLFLCEHYPPWSSGPHGAGNEPTSLQGRKYVLPLLKKYAATALIAGHEHLYERCEPPEGVSIIVSGGTGAPLYSRMLTPAQNPYSKVFVSTYNYCLFTVDGKQCSMQALTPEGKLLDSKVWPARVLP